MDSWPGEVGLIGWQALGLWPGQGKVERFRGLHRHVISNAGNLEHIAATMEKLKAKVSLYVDKASTRGSVEHRNTTATVATAPVLVPMTGGALRKKRHIAK